MNTATDSRPAPFHARSHSIGRLDIRWFPGFLVLITVLLQVSVWDAPETIRWDGSLREWPIPWLVCCNSITGFISVMVVYLASWIAFIATALQTTWRWILINYAVLLMFPAFVYAYMYFLYFGWPV
ncbi:MAG: hypothetical protein AAF802_28975 [Planctomycetota bacterium]